MPHSRAIAQANAQSRWVVITGGGGGVGAAVAQRLWADGYSLVLMGRTAAALTQVAQKLQSKTDQVIETAVLDVSDEAALRSWSKVFAKRWRTLHGLVTCAGSSFSHRLADATSEGFQEDLCANLTGTFLPILYCSPLMIAGGSIVTISSIFAQLPSKSALGYAAAKAGVIQLTKSVALQLAEQQIRANCIAPTAIYPTGMSQKWDEERRAKIAASIPMKRLATPEDIAASAAFFISPDSAFVTGQTLGVNGGECM